MAEMQFCTCESYDCRGGCCGLGRCSCSGELWGAKVDAILPDGTHRYWSTHCRHGHHGLCSAKRIVGAKEDGSGQAAIERKPAQCKTCAAQCVCPCHQATP